MSFDGRQGPHPTPMSLNYRPPPVLSEDVTVESEVTESSKPYTHALFSIFIL